MKNNESITKPIGEWIKNIKLLNVLNIRPHDLCNLFSLHKKYEIDINNPHFVAVQKEEFKYIFQAHISNKQRALYLKLCAFYYGTIISTT